jgi:hypothetical protein
LVSISNTLLQKSIASSILSSFNANMHHKQGFQIFRLFVQNRAGNNPNISYSLIAFSLASALGTTCQKENWNFAIAPYIRKTIALKKGAPLSLVS